MGNPSAHSWSRSLVHSRHRPTHIMPHGDFSDVSALLFFVGGATSIYAPELAFASFGPLKPMFEVAASPELLTAIRFAGGALLIMAPTLYVTRWNKLNGKAAALGMLLAAGNTAKLVLAMDSYVFVPRGWYIFIAVFVISALHLAFNANPMLTSAMLLEKEQKRAAKAKAK